MSWLCWLCCRCLSPVRVRGHAAQLLVALRGMTSQVAPSCAETAPLADAEDGSGAGAPTKDVALPATGCKCSRRCKLVSLIVAAVVLVVGTVLLLMYLIEPTDPDPLPPACEHNCTGFNHSQWTTLLAKHLRPSSLGGISYVGLDYEGVRTEPAFRAYLGRLKSADVSRMSNVGRKALFINAYNAYAVRLLLDECGTSLCSSIKDIGSVIRPVWKRPAGHIGGGDDGNLYSLDNIEHDYLRATFSDARIHAAVNCASVSCPDLHPVAFEESTLDAQLASASRDWMANPAKGAYRDAAGGGLTLSKIFDWYNDDFVNWAGGVVNFVRSYSPSPMAALLSNASPSVSYFRYDWSINNVT
jgi:hypothetical protein